MRKHQSWWRSWPVEALSPLNPEAVAAAQLSPPEWDKVYRHMYTERQWAQLFWLQWYARSDLRDRQMYDYRFYVTETHLSIHPETIGEWCEPPQWADTRLRQQEWDIRAHTLQSYGLTVEQCRSIHPDTWTPTSLGFQAAQSEEHGTVLLVQIHLLDTSALGDCIGEYVRRGRTLTGPCGMYLQERAMGMAWTYRLAHTLMFYLKPFPEELLPCLLNSSNPELRQMGRALRQ